MSFLSALERPSVLQHITNHTFDLIVIGGGVTGAGIALDAASRGLKVVLLEKNDFASGTSSKSTKLIHGGLRYLKQLEIALVREVGRERATVHRLAPHLVRAEKMLLPLTEGGTYGRFSTSVGLFFYDLLAEVQGADKRVMLSPEQTNGIEPLLKTEKLVGGGLYAEYRTDDARLTLELIKTAHDYGAVSLNYLEVVDFIYENGKIVGIQGLDHLGNKPLNISSKYVVSAAGPWVDQLRKKDNSLKGKHLFLSKGVHIVVAHERLPLRQAVYFDVPDGRMMFAIPRNRVTYIGTTDTRYEGDLNRVLANRNDVHYILEAVNNMFEGSHLRIEDVESSWAGLRPLIHEEGKSPSEMSRKDEIFESESGLISIAGGKLTGYRKMAERILDVLTRRIRENENQHLKPCITDTIELTGGPFDGEKAVQAYIETIQQQLAQLELPDYYGAYLVENYGRQADDILASISQFNDSPVQALLRAELAHCVQKELTFTALDFYVRRTGRLYFNIASILPSLELILSDMATFFNWEPARIKQEKEAVEQAIRDVSVFAAP